MLLLSQQAYTRIDKEIAKYPIEQKQSAVMASLIIAQREYGWVSPEIMQEVANYLQMPVMAVKEVASFYNMYQLKPVGKHKITVCTNLPCVLNNGVVTLEYLKKSLNINVGETTTDGLFTLIEGECMGACGDSPVLLVNNHKMHCKMQPEHIDVLLAELKVNS